MENKSITPQESINFAVRIRAIMRVRNIICFIVYAVIMACLLLAVPLITLEYRPYAGFILGVAACIGWLTMVVCEGLWSHALEQYEKWWSEALLQAYRAADHERHSSSETSPEHIRLSAWAATLAREYCASRILKHGCA